MLNEDVIKLIYNDITEGEKTYFEATSHALVQAHDRKISEQQYAETMAYGVPYLDEETDALVLYSYEYQIALIIKNSKVLTVYEGDLKGNWKVILS
ncbi:hypothetical protein [Chengkuizengella marina]|uniref:Uncharacterized protein n=1 Tax=Chengkuizengella marina TaxID=2507566 RepID=A0A6N9Q5P6_9BACL|nr:hypothetical protein [Chengkuizengella marina]NBI30189.1 hypothetical protein [Chengkuizengella marina]